MKKFVVFVFALTVLSYATVFISPAVFWPIGLVNYLIPLLITLQIILLFFAFFRNRKLVWLPLLCLASGYYFIDITFNWPVNQTGTSDFEMLSFNTRYFRERRNYDRIEMKTIEWALKEDSDIKCFQEFIIRPEHEKADIISKMEARGYFSYAESLKVEDSPFSPGLAIFSKFPIVNTGLILLNKNSINNCIFADVVFGSDTLRIYNFHLKSMGLHLHRLKEPDNFSETSKETATKLGSASSKRALELEMILDHVQQCPYPYVLACDFNELIYGNNYYKVREYADNAFEEAGKGFGFTFNSLLFFIRLDHQFFSQGIEAVNFEVIKKVKSSDHFPVKGYYRLQKE